METGRVVAKTGPGPLPLLSVAYAAGTGLAAHVSDLPSTPLGVGVFPLALLAFVASRRGLRKAALALAVLCFALTGAARGGLAAGPGPSDGPCAAALAAHDLPVPTERSPALLRIEGAVEGEPRFLPTAGIVRLRVDRAGEPRARPDGDLPAMRATPGLAIQLSLPAELRPFPGDRLLVEATLDEVPLDGADNGAQRERLQREGIACMARLAEGRAAVIEPAGGFAAAVETRRRMVIQEMRARMEPGPAAGLVVALSLGDRAGIDTEQAVRFSDSGLAHILSVSGMHLALTVLGFYRLLAWALRRTSIGTRLDPQRVAAAVSLPLSPAYALLTGATPPVVRAAIAAGLYLFAVLAGRAPDAWTALALGLLAILAFSPAALFDPSVQLSFVACWGLLAVVRPVRALVPLAEPAPDAPRWRGWIELPIAALVTAAAATIATLPFTALHFERVSLASLPANVAAAPVGAPLTIICALAALAGLIHPALLDLPLLAALPFASALDWLAAWFATWPGARIPLPAGRGLVWVLALLPLALVLRGRFPRTGAAALVAVFAAIVWLRLPPAPDGKLHIEFLPVGQGDCTLLRLPDGSAILVDAGGDPSGRRDVGTTRVLPQLHRRGVTRLEAIAVSHLHPDHVGGIPGLLRSLDVGEVWTTGRALEGPWGGPLAAAMREAGVPRRVLGAGDRLERAGVLIEVLGPPDIDGQKDDPLLEENDASLVLRVVHGDVSVLLPGDIEEIGEWALVESGANVQAQLLKAPHHGSRTSSTPGLLDAVQPGHVVFCVGHRNRFGFPHRDVVERYEARNCSLHRTDRGPVHFTSDGVSLRFVHE